MHKAATIRPRELVGHWLYGVAYRTALKAKGLAARRRAKEGNMPPPETHHDEPPVDWLPLLDEELQRLPDKYRLPLVLCDLDGKTRKEAARQLGWPDGTLSTRLTRARVLLAQRLTRRGVALAGVAAVATALGGAASAQVPAALTKSTVEAAMGVAAGHVATVVSSNVAVLTEGVLKTMLLTKLKTVLATGLVLALVGLGIGAGAFRTTAGAQVPPPATPSSPAIAPTAYQLPPALAKLSVRLLPAPALVSLTNTGTIGVTHRGQFYMPVTTVNGKREAVTSYQLVERTDTDQYSREDVRVYDSAGKLLTAKDVSRLLKEDVIALVYGDGDKPDPEHLKLFKDGLLFVVLPAPLPPKAAPAVVADHVADNNDTPVPSKFYEEVPTTKPGNHLTREQRKLFDELQGEWQLVSCTEGGRKVPVDKLNDKDFRFEISQGNVLHMGTGTKNEQTAGRKTIMVRPGTPNEFDITTYDVDDDTKVSLGIYKLNDDELTIVLAPPGSVRPRRFEVPEGSKHSVLVLRRGHSSTTRP